MFGKCVITVQTHTLGHHKNLIFNSPSTLLLHF